MFQFPESLSPEEFLRQYWQKSHLYMPRALPQALPELTADELGWLATLDDVESRLIFSAQQNGVTHYRVEHGPFDESELASLPSENWTLLVQDVDKHLPVFRRLLLEASFVPDWRIDDLMVSFAASGGSVGPHRDNYDVFLCQGAGRREWRVAAADAQLARMESAELSLLEPFTVDKPIEAGHRDVLYLPPGIAHWGIALERCMTYSIGMRAPTLREFVAGMSRVLDIGIDQGNIEDLFYRDPDLSERETAPGLISARAIERARETFSPHVNLDHDAFAKVFGSVVSDVKGWLAPELPNQREIDEFLALNEAQIRVHGMARLAYIADSQQNYVFANGFCRAVSLTELETFRRICAGRMASVGNSGLFLWLLAHGAFDLATDELNCAT